MSKFARDFAQIRESVKLAEDLRGRVIGSQLGVVSVNEDPLNLRRIKVNFAENPDLDSYWIMRSPTYHDIDPPLPKIGQTVLIEFVNGDITMGFYRVVQNDVNKPHFSDNPAIDLSVKIEGDRISQIQGDDRSTANNHLRTSVVEDKAIVGGIFTVDAVGSINHLTLGSFVVSSTGSATFTCGGYTTTFGADGNNTFGGNNFNVQSNNFKWRDETIATKKWVEDYVHQVTGEGSRGNSIN